jgi:hypothetical protein
MRISYVVQVQTGDCSIVWLQNSAVQLDRLYRIEEKIRMTNPFKTYIH